MDYNAKRAKLSGVIYIILALMLASIMCVTIFTAISSRKDTPAPEVTDAPAPVITTAAPQSEATAPVNAGVEAIDGLEPESEPVIAPAEEQTPEFIMPVGGKISALFRRYAGIFDNDERLPHTHGRRYRCTDRHRGALLRGRYNRERL